MNYRHTKTGNLYEYVCEATHSETQEDLVIYRSLKTGKTWARPKAMFFEKVQIDGKEVFRFEREVDAPEDNPCGELDLLPRC